MTFINSILLCNNNQGYQLSEKQYTFSNDSSVNEFLANLTPANSYDFHWILVKFIGILKYSHCEDICCPSLDPHSQYQVKISQPI